MKKYFAVLIISIVCYCNSSAQSFSLQNGSDLVYLVYGDTGALNLHIFVESVTPDFKFAWILNCKQEKNDTGMFTVAAKDLLTASTLWMNIDSSLKSGKGMTSFLLSKIMFDELGKDTVMKATMKMGINSTKKITMGEVTTNKDDIVINYSDYLVPVIVSKEMLDEKGKKIDEGKGAAIRFMNNPACPLITYYQNKTGNFQLVLVSANNVLYQK